MGLRVLKRNVLLALFKREKLHLEHLRGLRKGVIGSSKDSSNDDNCIKCKKIITKAFGVDDEPVTYATNAKQDEEKSTQKLETIVEHPLVEAEAKVVDLKREPKLLASHQLKTSSLDYWQPKNYEYTINKVVDELACKLMHVPVDEIDTRLVDKHLNSRKEMKDEGAYQIANAENTELDDNLGSNYESDNKEEKITLTPLLVHKEYKLYLEGESLQNTWKAEKFLPMHFDVEFLTYIEKCSKREMILKKLQESFGHELIAQEMALIPLPPNDTSISSNMDTVTRNVTKEPHGFSTTTAISYNTLPKPRGSGYKDRWRSENEGESFDNSRQFSTVLPNSASAQNLTMHQQTMSDASAPILKPKSRTNLDEDNLPLSELLKRVRLRNRIEQVLQNNEKVSPRTLFSKHTCIPPLDKQPRSKNCPPKPCPPPKKDPPKKSNPCPAPKKDPCDPCKAPPRCPSKKSPCGFYSGNKIKDAITLILCGLAPTNILRQSYGLPLLWNFGNNFVKDSISRTLATVPIAENASKSHRNVALDSVAVEITAEEKEEIVFARSFEPWSPIPSWPLPKKKAQKRLICPKEGCKSPKQLDAPCKGAFPCSPKSADRKS